MLHDMLEVLASIPVGVAIVALMLWACWAVDRLGGGR